MTDDLKLLMDLANSESVELLPKDLRDRVMAFKDKKEKEDLKRAEDARAAAEKLAEEDRKKNDEEYRELLCIGGWGEKVPRERRFALCYKMGKFSYDGDNWHKEPFYCAIDLVRGYKSPYWYYYGSSTEAGQRDAFYNERIRPVLEASDSSELVRVLRRDWNFFKIYDSEESEKFKVLKYHVEKGAGVPFNPRRDGWKADLVVVDDMSEYKTLAEHQSDLKKEFCE